MRASRFVLWIVGGLLMAGAALADSASPTSLPSDFPAMSSFAAFLAASGSAADLAGLSGTAPSPAAFCDAQDCFNLDCSQVQCPPGTFALPHCDLRTCQAHCVCSSPR